MSSNEQPPAIELKSIHANLKYAFLKLEEIFHVIVSSKLEFEQEQKLLQVLRKHKKAIEWTLTDISLSIYMHQILLDNGENKLGSSKGNLIP